MLRGPVRCCQTTHTSGRFPATTGTDNIFIVLFIYSFTHAFSGTAEKKKYVRINSGNRIVLQAGCYE